MLLFHLWNSALHLFYIIIHFYEISLESQSIISFVFFLSENYWIISDLSPSIKYIFRVRARNKYGYSEFSKPSKSFDFTEAAMLAEQQELGVVLGTSIPFLSIAVMLASFYSEYNINNFVNSASYWPVIFVAQYVFFSCRTTGRSKYWCHTLKSNVVQKQVFSTNSLTYDV